MRAQRHPRHDDVDGGGCPACPAAPPMQFVPRAWRQMLDAAVIVVHHGQAWARGQLCRRVDAEIQTTRLRIVHDNDIDTFTVICASAKLTPRLTTCPARSAFASPTDRVTAGNETTTCTRASSTSASRLPPAIGLRGVGSFMMASVAAAWLPGSGLFAN
jgi:hypothetical protein